MNQSELKWTLYQQPEWNWGSLSELKCEPKLTQVSHVSLR